MKLFDGKGDHKLLFNKAMNKYTVYDKIIPYTAKYSRRKTFKVFVIQTMAFSIGNISPQTCYCKFSSE